MDAIASIKEQLSFGRFILKGTTEGTTQDQAHWMPAGNAHSIAATYAHLILSEDGLINGMLQGKQPLAATSWAGKTGVDSMPPQGSEGIADWSEWAGKVKVDLAAFAAFAAYHDAVAAATDAYVNGLSESDLDRQLETPLGSQSVNQMIGIITSHLSLHGGEISAVKGLQGLKGYPV